MPTQDAIGLSARGEHALLAPDANVIVTAARRLLRDVLPQSVHDEHAWAGTIVQLHADGETVLQALRVHAGAARATGGDADVRVHVQERYLSVAGVVGLLDDGARRTGTMPLHTGRYVHVTVASSGEALAVLWLPSVPVFRVSDRLVA